MQTVSSRPRSIAMLALLAVGLSRDVTAQSRIHIPFVRASQTLAASTDNLTALVLKRTCQLTLIVTDATRADVKNWKFTLAGTEMTALGLPGDDQPADYIVKVPKTAPDSMPLILTGAPAAAIASLGTISLHAANRGDQEKCDGPDRPPDAAGGGGRRSTGGYPVTYDHSHRIANLRFNSFGLPDTTAKGTPEKFPSGITDNDVITVLLDLPDTAKVNTYSVQISGNIKGEEINILGQGDLSKIPGIGLPFGTETAVIGSSVYSMGSFGPYSAPQVTIRIIKTVDNKAVVDRSYTLRVRRTYLAALRLGVGRSGVRFSDFEAGPRSRTDTTQIIRDLSQSKGREVRPYLTLVFYGWRFWEKGFWDGRDIEAEPTMQERLNPMVGTGLKKLGEEWLLGFSFEVARGLDASIAYQTAKVSVLQSGFHTDSSYTGSVPPPTSREWKSGVVVGASLDLRVAVGVLSGLLSGNK